MTHYTDHLAGRITDADLADMSKADLNNQLQNPMSASKLKKTKRGDLLAMVRAETTPAPLHDAQPSDTPKLTDLEQRVLVAYLSAGIDSNGAESLDAMLGDNMTWGDVPEIAERTGLTQKQVKGVIASLDKKCLLVITDEAVNGEGPVQQVLADKGVRVAFELLAAGVEADAPAPKPARKPRALKAHTFCEPANKMEDVKAIRAGTKRALLAEALAKGATLDELVELLGWSRDVVSSAFRVDLGSMGYGVRRDDAGVYRLILPMKVKRPLIRDANTTVEETFVAACK